MVIVHPLGCGFGSIGGASNMNTHSLESLVVLDLLPLNPTCETGDQCSQEGDRGRNEIR